LDEEGMIDISKQRMNGVHKFLNTKGVRESQHTKVVNKYLKSINADEELMNDTFRRKSKFIQNDFGAFVRWYYERINKTPELPQ